MMLQAGSILDLEAILGGLAAIAALRGRPESAARLWGAFERLDAEAERKLDEDDRARYERALGNLDESQVEAGRSLSDDEALALARELGAQLRRGLSQKSPPPPKSPPPKSPPPLKSPPPKLSQPPVFRSAPGAAFASEAPPQVEPRTEPTRSPGRIPPP